MVLSKILLLKMIPFMNGFVYVKELSSRLYISYNVCNDMLEELVRLGIGKRVYSDKGDKDEALFLFDLEDRINVVMLALRLNASIEEVTSVLNWKDFEILTSNILEENGYKVARNVRLKQNRCRLEIDVVGRKYINGKCIALVIDCKHWSYITGAALKVIVKKQVRRASMLVEYDNSIDIALPIILTLRDIPMLIDGVPIIPISRLRSFLYEYDINDDRITLVTKH